MRRRNRFTVPDSSAGTRNDELGAPRNPLEPVKPAPNNGHHAAVDLLAVHAVHDARGVVGLGASGGAGGDGEDAEAPGAGWEAVTEAMAEHGAPVTGMSAVKGFAKGGPRGAGVFGFVTAGGDG